MTEPLLASVVDDELVVTGLTYGDKPLIKQLPGAKYKHGQWRLPKTWTHAKSLRYAFGQRLQLDQAMVSWAQRELTNRVAPSLSIKDLLAPEIEDPQTRLFPYQDVGVVWLNITRHCILADEPGTGKTVQVCAALSNVRVGPFLVICPNSVVHHWAKHVEEWTSFKPLVVKGSAAQRKKLLATADEQTVVIINWEGVRGHSRLAGYGSLALRRCSACGGDDSVAPSRCEAHPKELNEIPFVVVVADEAHKLADPRSKQTRAVWAVAKDARYRWALTGTPLTNHLADMWSLLHFIRPEEFTSRNQFIDRYCLASYNAWGGLEVKGINPQHEAEFKEILAPLMRRVRKIEVLPQLPKKPTHAVRHVELTKQQRKMYQELDDKLMTKDESGRRLFAVNDLVAQIRLLQLSSATVELVGDDQVKLCEPSPKLDAFMEFLDEDQEESIVVFAQSRQLLELLALRLDQKLAETPGPLPWQWSYSTYYGLQPGYSDDDRQRGLELFQDGKRRLLLSTLQSGSVGLNLTVASTEVFLQRNWSLVDNLQAEDRFHRPGAERHERLQIIDFVALDTVEEDQIDAVHRKLEYLDQVTDDSERAALLAEELLA